MTRSRLYLPVVLSVWGMATVVWAAPFISGNLVVSKVGDATWSADAAMPVSLVEFAPAAADGQSVQVIPLPTEAAGQNRRLTLNGDMRSGMLSRSGNGLYLLVGGYDAEVGTLSVNTANPATINRVVALVDQSGAVNTTTALIDCYGNGANAAFRSVTSEDGITIYTAGRDGTSSSAARVRITTRGDTTSTALCGSCYPKEPRVVNVYNGRLYVCANETQVGGRGVATHPTALPTGPNETPVLVPDIKVAESAESGSPYDFIFIDQDTVYLADDRHPEALGGLQKFVRNLDPQSPAFGKFQYKYTLNAGLAPTPAQALRAVTGKREGAHVVLYAITADDYPPNNLVTVTDTGCPTGAEAGCSAADTFSVLQTSPAGSLFRGVRLAPGPCAGAECLGACCMAGNTCADTDAESCPGVWRGLGTTCAQGTCPLVCPSPFADADLDKDVDTADFAVLQRCLTPSGQTISDECTCFDRPEPGFPDGNGAIDQTDLAAFVACGSGADVPADAGCADAE